MSFMEYFFFLSLFFKNRLSLDFKGRCVKGKPSLIFLPLTMWSHQHLISKKEDSLYKRKHIWKISTFSFITAVLGNRNRMLFYLIFVSRGLRDKGLEGGERPVRRSSLCLLFSCSLSLFPLHAGQPPGQAKPISSVSGF